MNHIYLKSGLSKLRIVLDEIDPILDDTRSNNSSFGILYNLYFRGS